MERYRFSDYVSPSAFTDQFRFAALLLRDGKQAGPFSFELFVSLTNDHQPYGFIYGNRKSYIALEAFFQSGSSIVQLESIPASSLPMNIEIKTFIIQSIHFTTMFDDEPDVLHSRIGFFRADGVSMTRHVEAPNQHRQLMTFLLTGPCEQWGIRHFPRSSTDGTIQIEQRKREFRLDHFDGFNFSFLKHFIFRHGSQETEIGSHINQARPPGFRHRDFNIQADLFAVRITIDDRVDPLVFQTQALIMMNSFCDLVSFSGRARTNWFSYNYFGFNEEIKHYRGWRTDYYPKHRMEDCPVQSWDVEEFLEICTKKYIDLLEHGNGLRPILTQYAESRSSKFVNDIFKSLFNCLEQLVTLNKENISRNMLMSNSQLEKIREMVRDFLKNDGAQDTNIESVIKKLGNSVDPGIRDSIIQLLKFYNISIDDIGGEEMLRSVLNTRNKLIHSNKEPDIVSMIEGYEFLSTVIERIVFAMLGWSKGLSSLTSSSSRYLTPRQPPESE